MVKCVKLMLLLQNNYCASSNQFLHLKQNHSNNGWLKWVRNDLKKEKKGNIWIFTKFSIEAVVNLLHKDMHEIQKVNSTLLFVFKNPHQYFNVFFVTKNTKPLRGFEMAKRQNFFCCGNIEIIFYNHFKYDTKYIICYRKLFKHYKGR